MTDIDDRTRRVRSHQFAGAAALVLAVGSVFVFLWVAPLSMALIGVGNLLAARGVKDTGTVPLPAKVLMIVGVLGFLGFVIALVVRAAGAS
ncbi:MULTISPECIES: hypothetical protein [unclassified Pseudonocardia]|uniref:hypothetical protein n=1 Tax=unclassified Pseudonocardia TaxID=2619320 RepID=UPI000969EB6A|nr:MULTISPECIES: hypothetical protein [unclassified Pseudonocardia]OJY37741.1 MAG: hypothetical protein BGP03_17995 [Pseudonocardia sp. 73-21]